MTRLVNDRGGGGGNPLRQGVDALATAWAGSLVATAILGSSSYPGLLGRTLSGTYSSGQPVTLIGLSYDGARMAPGWGMPGHADRADLAIFCPLHACLDSQSPALHDLVAHCSGDGHYQLHLLFSRFDYERSEGTCKDRVAHAHWQTDMAGSGGMPVFGRPSALWLWQRSARDGHSYGRADLHPHRPCHRGGNSTACGGAYPDGCGDRPQGGAEGPRFHADNRGR